MPQRPQNSIAPKRSGFSHWEVVKPTVKCSAHHVSEEGHHDGDDAGDAHIGGSDDQALHT
jgi:hypothetical protein